MKHQDFSYNIINITSICIKMSRYKTVSYEEFRLGLMQMGFSDAEVNMLVTKIGYKRGDMYDVLMLIKEIRSAYSPSDLIKLKRISFLTRLTNTDFNIKW